MLVHVKALKLPTSVWLEDFTCIRLFYLATGGGTTDKQKMLETFQFGVT